MRTSWDERYGAAGYLFGTEPNDFLVEVAERIPYGPVLCLADGEGRNSVFLASRGYPVMGVDSSTVGLEKARQLATARRVTVAYVQADLNQFRFEPDVWTGIVSIFMHVPPELRAKLYREATKALEPGGVVVVEAYTPRQIGRGTGGPSDPALMPTLADLRAELAGLEFEIGREVTRQVIEGSGHTGEADVVQVLARKPRRSQ